MLPNERASFVVQPDDRATRLVLQLSSFEEQTVWIAPDSFDKRSRKLAVPAHVPVKRLTAEHATVRYRDLKPIRHRRRITPRPPEKCLHFSASLKHTV
jgi:hypothetical protein